MFSAERHIAAIDCCDDALLLVAIYQQPDYRKTFTVRITRFGEEFSRLVDVVLEQFRLIDDRLFS